MEKSPNHVQNKPIRLMVAACNDMGIAKDGKLPWDLPSEFKYFLDTITRVSRPGNMNLLVWGRRCWISHPENTFPLANSLHAVLSKTLSTVPDHAHFLCRDFESAIQLASEPPLAGIIETIWIIGGTQVYEDALKHPWCDLIYLTDVMADFDCDVFFPEFDRELFKVQESFPDVPTEIQEENGLKFKCQVFKKVTAEAP
ncbi:dihydrofolate reductase-like [Xenentodon cancila]